MVRLGEEVKDRISGFAGVVTARTEFENGCIRCCVTARELNEGKVVDQWFDEQRLVRDPCENSRYAREATAVRAEKQADVGGPGPSPPHRDPPTRGTG